MVPDTIEFFGGTAGKLPPRMFVRPLWLWLRAPREGREWGWDPRMNGLHDKQDVKEFVQRLRMIDILTWMKGHVRKELAAHMKDPKGKWLRGMERLFPALRIEYPF
ncbi:hypothetical protein F4823DRAFT_254039 [Ustulina deusta]|nr:hypothetical protein F4823DRAFT_254039 [Ustulina deusta]